jgi:hypothetical protein
MFCADDHLGSSVSAGSEIDLTGATNTWLNQWGVSVWRRQNAPSPSGYGNGVGKGAGRALT